MLLACWSPKGGSGTTVVTCSVGLLLARAEPVLLADLAGDIPAVLGIADPENPGWNGWIGAEADVPPDRLRDLEVEVGDGLGLLASGAGPGRFGEGSRPQRVQALAEALVSERRTVVADCGLLASPAATAVAAAAQVGLVVLRPCYLALRRALQLPVRPTGIILLRERNRALTCADVEDVLGAPVKAQIDIDPCVARTVDAGLLARRLPRTLERGLRGVA